MNDILDKIGLVLSETTQSTQMICRECGNKFRKKIGKKTFEVKCPKCGSYDTDINESTVTTSIATNKAQGHIDVIGMRYKKKKRRSKLTGAPIVIHESMKNWNYTFRGVSGGTMTIRANSKEGAIKKIKKEWGIKNSLTPTSLFVWCDELKED